MAVKFRTGFVLGLTASLLLVMAAAGLFSGWLPLPAMPAWLKRREVSAGWRILEETRDLSTLHAAEYAYRYVFPYDFTEGEADWINLRYFYGLYGPDGYRDRTEPGFWADGTLPDLWRNAELYRICREAGLDPAARAEFAVISTVVRAGIDLSDIDPGQVIREDRPDGEFRTIRLRLPPAVGTDFEVREDAAADEEWPDPRMTPEGWRLIISWARPRIEQMARDEGLLEEADEAVRNLMEDLMKGAGYDRVRFD